MPAERHTFTISHPALPCNGGYQDSKKFLDLPISVMQITISNRKDLYYYLTMNDRKRILVHRFESEGDASPGMIRPTFYNF